MRGWAIMEPVLIFLPLLLLTAQQAEALQEEVVPKLQLGLLSDCIIQNVDLPTVDRWQKCTQEGALSPLSPLPLPPEILLDQQHQNHLDTSDSYRPIAGRTKSFVKVFGKARQSVKSLFHGRHKIINGFLTIVPEELPAEQQDSEIHVSNLQEIGDAETSFQNEQQHSDNQVSSVQDIGNAETPSQKANSLDAVGDEHTPKQVAAMPRDVPDTSKITDGSEKTENGNPYSACFGPAFLAAGAIAPFILAKLVNLKRRKHITTHQYGKASSATEEPSNQNVNETDIGISVELLGSQIGTVLGTVVSELLNSKFRKPEEALSAEEVAVLIERTMKELLNPVLKCKNNTFVEGFVHSFRSILFITKCFEDAYANKLRTGMNQVINSQDSPPEEQLQPASTENSCAVAIKRRKVHTSLGSMNQEAGECYLNEYSDRDMFETLQRASGNCLENASHLSNATKGLNCTKGELKDCRFPKDKQQCVSDDPKMILSDASEPLNGTRADVRDCGFLEDIGGKQKHSKKCICDDQKVMLSEEIFSAKADISSLDDNVNLVSTDDIIERLEKLEIGNFSAVDKQPGLLVLADKGLASLSSQEAQMPKCIVTDSYCAPAVGNFQQQFLNILEKSVSVQERSNQIKSLELFQKVKQLNLKEEHLHVASETNSLMKKSINLNKTRFHFKMQDTQDRKLMEAYAALSRTFAAGLTEGLIVMLLMLLYGATTYSYHKISEHVSVCHPVHKESSRFSWVRVDWLFHSLEMLSGHFYAMSCRTFVMGRMVFGLAVIALVASMLLRYTINTSNQAVPAAIILIVLGVICGFAGKISVESLGGSGKHWLFIWEVFCLIHAFASWFTPSLFHLLNDPSSRPQKSWFFQRSRQNMFCLILNFFIPVIAGLIPFASLSEAIPKLLKDICALVTRSGPVS